MVHLPFLLANLILAIYTIADEVFLHLFWSVHLATYWLTHIILRETQVETRTELSSILRVT